MLPTKTFLCRDVHLQESDFDANSQLRHSHTLQFMQNLATDHAEMLGFGWHTMNDNGLLWVLGKIKVKYFKSITKPIKCFKLYTWPIAPSKFFADRLCQLPFLVYPKFQCRMGRSSDILILSNIFLCCLSLCYQNSHCEQSQCLYCIFP